MTNQLTPMPIINALIGSGLGDVPQPTIKRAEFVRALGIRHGETPAEVLDRLARKRNPRARKSALLLRRKGGAWARPGRGLVG
jgi:hypothetical protein